MFISYLKDMKSWILFFICAAWIVDLLLWLDQGIDVEFTAVLYFNILLFYFLLLFIRWRYRVETKFTKELVSLIEEQTDDWHEALPVQLLHETKCQRNASASSRVIFERAC